MPRQKNPKTGPSNEEASQHGPRQRQGLVQIYTGDGKGKTTAALGLALRAVGHGWKVRVIQFLKGNSHAGELAAAQRLFPYLTIYQFGRGCPYSGLIREGFKECTGCGECFIGKNGVTPEIREMTDLAMEHTREVLAGGEYDMVILDEIGNALRYKLVTEEQVKELMALKPAHVELILTGRGMTPALIEAADLVTEMKAIKHPFNAGVSSRLGIEY